MQYKFCIHCGKKIPKGIKFCPYCGTKQSSNVDEQVNNKQDTVSNNQNKVSKPSNVYKHKTTNKRKTNHKHNKKISKMVVLVIVAIIVVLGCGKLYTIHEHHVAINQITTNFNREKAHKSTWKIGAGTFSNDYKQAALNMGTDTYYFSHDRIKDTNPSHNGVAGYSLNDNTGVLSTVDLYLLVDFDGVLKDKNADNQMVSQSDSPDKVVKSTLDTSQNDKDAIANALGTQSHNFIIFRAESNGKGVTPYQFIIFQKQ